MRSLNLLNPDSNNCNRLPYGHSLRSSDSRRHVQAALSTTINSRSSVMSVVHQGILHETEMRRQRLTAQAPDQPPGREQMVRQQPYVRTRNDGTYGLGRRLQMRRPRERRSYNDGSFRPLSGRSAMIVKTKLLRRVKCTCLLR